MPLKTTHKEPLIFQRLDKVMDIWLMDKTYVNKSPKTIAFYREFIVRMYESPLAQVKGWIPGEKLCLL